MKKFFTICLAMFLTAAMAFGQGSITGKVVDSSTDEPLIGATVLVKGTMAGTITDFDGMFTLANMDKGDYTIVLTYTGFEEMEIDVSLDGSTDLGTIGLGFEAVGLEGVEVIASVARDRRTPVAVSTISGEQVEALVGNQEYPEILRKTPSIYVTKQGGGFGDSRINVRGFDQRNTAVMINGIPVNDMENGWVYWSNWAGLSDVTSTLQVQRGLGASKLAVASVGGSINIITDAAQMNKGGAASVSFGNDGYQKYGLVLSTGLGESGWAFSFQGTHTRGDGYVDGTAFRAYSYFASLSKIFNNKHSISMTVLGAPQWHHQRLTASRFDNISIRTFVDPDDPNNDDPTTGVGIRFNHTWGMLGGEEFNWRRNFYHKPKAFINHYWNISPKTDLKTSAYVSLGRGGGTGPRGRLRTPGSIFDSFGGFGTGTHNADGQVRFDDLVAYNQGQVVADWGDAKEQLNGQYLVGNGGRIDGDNVGSGYIRRASMNSHNWFGVLSTLTTKLNDNLTLVAGFDGRYYKGIHYRRVENLLGADGYVSQSDDNNPMNLITETVPADFGSFGDDTHDPGGNVLNYYNDGVVNWLGLFGQLEYSNDKLSAFLSLSGSSQGFKRIDYFNYEEGDTPSNDINNDGEYRESEWENFLGGTVKGGLNYNLDAQNNVFVNGGYFSRQPIFDNVFLNFRNQVNETVQNQSVVAFEAGYGFRSNNFSAKINAYYTEWGNRQFDQSFSNFQYINTGGDTLVVDALVVFENVAQTHTGLELEMSYSPFRALQLNGMLSLGNWEYTDDFFATLTDTDNNVAIREEKLATNGLKVGDAAQTTFSIGASYEVISGLRVYADYYYADNLYAEWSIEDGVPEQVVQLPSYNLVDAGVSYNFDLGSTNCTLRFNMNNVTDEIYIAELDTNIPDDPNTAVNELYDNRGNMGFGRTWNAGFKVRF